MSAAVATFVPVSAALPVNYTLTQPSTYQGISSGPNSNGQLSINEGGLWTPLTPNGPIGNVTSLGEGPTGASGFRFQSGQINDWGQIAGVGYWEGTNRSQVYLWTPATAHGTTGGYKLLTQPGEGTSSPVTLTNYGQVSYYRPSGREVWTPATANDTTGLVTATLGSQFYIVVGANAYGQYLYPGEAYSYAQAPALFTPTQPRGSVGTTVVITGPPNAVWTQAKALNEGGVVVGVSCVNQPSGGCVNKGFIWTPTTPNGTTGTSVEIPLPAGVTAMTATALNQNGDVVGTMTQSVGFSVPFLYRGGIVYDLSIISGALRNAMPIGINNAGQIVLTGSGNFLLTPITPLPSYVPLSIESTPTGMNFAVDGQSYAAPKTLYLIEGTKHRISFAPTVQSAGGSRLGFAGWSDGVTASVREITASSGLNQLSGRYVPQYQITLTTNPATGGTLNAMPVSPDRYYNSDTTVQITAFANSAYVFSGFTGAIGGTEPVQSVIMSGPKSITALFTPVQNPDLIASVANDVSKTGQPGPSVNVQIRFTNRGAGAAKSIQITGLSARVMSPSFMNLVPTLKLPANIGDIQPASASSPLTIPVSIPSTARRILLEIKGTLRNSAGRQFSFSSSVTILR